VIGEVFWAWDLGDRDTWDACAISKNVLGNSDKSRFSDFTFQTELKGNVWRGTFKKPGGLSMIDSVRLRWVDNENWLGKITGIKKKQTFVEIILNMAQLKLQRMNSPKLPSISELSRSIPSELTTPVLLEQNRSLERRKSDNSSTDSLDGLSRSLADQISKPPTLHDQQSVSTDISTPDEPNDSTLLPAWPTKHSLDGLSQSLADQISKPPTLRDPESLATTQRRHPTLRDPESLATTQRPPTLHDQQSVLTDISGDEPNDSTLLPAWLTKDMDRDDLDGYSGKPRRLPEDKRYSVGKPRRLPEDKKPSLDDKYSEDGESRIRRMKSSPKSPEELDLDESPPSSLKEFEQIHFLPKLGRKQTPI
jgi:hypothetical protein